MTVLIMWESMLHWLASRSSGMPCQHLSGPTIVIFQTVSKSTCRKARQLSTTGNFHKAGHNQSLGNVILSMRCLKTHNTRYKPSMQICDTIHMYKQHSMTTQCRSDKDFTQVRMWGVMSKGQGEDMAIRLDQRSEKQKKERIRLLAILPGAS